MHTAAVLWGCLVAPGLHAAAPQETASMQTETRSAVVTATPGAITIDGVLDEPIWGSAPRIGNLIQRQPVPGEGPTEDTEVTLLYDQDNLYIGVAAYDSEPQRVIGTEMARDASLRSDDRIEILLDTFRDQRNAFYFAANPLGALVDGLTFANGELNTDWDAIWHLRTRRTERGWLSEFAIPFKSLNFPAGRTVWGFNFSRCIYRKLEEVRWAGARLETQFLQVSEAGEITNLEGLTQGIGLELRPFIAGNALHFGDSGEEDFNGQPGLDLFYSMTPSGISRDSGEFRPVTRFRPARQRPVAPRRRELQPSPERLSQHSADVSRRCLHTLHATGQPPGRELGSVCHPGRLALQFRKQPPRGARHQSHLRATLRAVRNLTRRRPPAGRVPVHPLQERVL